MGGGKPSDNTPLDLANPESIKRCFNLLVEYAERDGFIVTVEQIPEAPLAMGNYKSMVTVRPKRTRA